MGNGHGCYVGHSYVTTFRSKRSGCHKSDLPVHHREVLDKRSIPDLNHSSALCAASYCHLRWSCARHVIRYACTVFLVGEPAWLPPRGSAEWAICYQLCRLPQFCGALDSAAAERESRSTLSLLPSGTRHHQYIIWRIRSSINCCRIVPSCPQVSSATVFAIASITSSASPVSTLSYQPAGSGYSAKKSSISSTIIK